MRTTKDTQQQTFNNSAKTSIFILPWGWSPNMSLAVTTRAWYCVVVVFRVLCREKNCGIVLSSPLARASTALKTSVSLRELLYEEERLLDPPPADIGRLVGLFNGLVMDEYIATQC
jgi:hypothetical protein